MARLIRITRANLRGVWSALIIPWTDRDRLDARRFVREVRSYAGTGVNGVYTGGTTGEFYAQDDRTFERMARMACEHAHEIGLPIQIGVSALSTRTVRQRIRVANNAGADAVQVALPFWLELKDDEVKRFVSEVAAEAGETPVVLYLTNRSKRKIAPQLLGEIAAGVPGLVGTKDTGCTCAELKLMLSSAPDLAIFGGEDFFEKIPAGGRGGYCAITGFNAEKVVQLYRLCAEGRIEEAKTVSDAIELFRMEAVIPLLSERGLWDSAIDRIMRVAGGGDVGLRCQSPYRSGTQADVEQLITFCRLRTPDLTPRHLLDRSR